MPFYFFLNTLRKCFAFQVQEQMESGQNFERLPELHALACGLKVVTFIFHVQCFELIRSKTSSKILIKSVNILAILALYKV